MSDEVIDLTAYRARRLAAGLNVEAIWAEADAEYEAAAPICDEILTGASVWWPHRLFKSGRVFTVGLVRRLFDRMTALMESRPEDALQLASMATDAVILVDWEKYSESIVLGLLSHGMRDHGYALFRLGRFREAMVSLKSSERWLCDQPIYDDDALLALVKAVVLRKLHRNRAAARLARKAAGAFALLFDRERYLIARRIQAAALYDAGQTERALGIRACLQGRDTPDWADEQHLERDLTACLYERADAAARAPFQRSSQSVLQAEAEWTMARMSMTYLGLRESFVEMLRTAWERLTTLGLPIQGTMAALDLAEGLVAQGKLAEVPPICDALMEQVTPFGRAPRAHAALSLLRRAATLELASPELVKATQVVVWGALASI